MSGPNASPLAGIPLEGIPLSAKNAILNCPTGTFLCEDDDTLGEAHAAGAIKPTARLQDLGHYKHANGQHITLGELVRGLPDDTSLYDLLATILLKPAYDWEALPLETFPLQDFSTDGGIGHVHGVLPPQRRRAPGRRRNRRAHAPGSPIRAGIDGALGWTGHDRRADADVA